MSDDEFESLADGSWKYEIESLRQQLEIERMRNVACDVVAMADTPTSAEEARKMLPDYRSAALESVIRRVDECIALRQQLADHIKREVMLRVKLSEIAWSNDSKWQSDCAKEALAATADLDGLILCHAELCRDDGSCQYAIDHGAEGLGHCPEGKCCMPLYSPKGMSE